MRWRWAIGGRIESRKRTGGRCSKPGVQSYVCQWQAALGGTTVEVDFEERSDGTVIRLREHGYPDTPEGWSGFLQLLDRMG